MDCFVASLLAMTDQIRVIASEAKQSSIVRSPATRKGRLPPHGLPRRCAPRNDGSDARLVEDWRNRTSPEPFETVEPRAGGFTAGFDDLMQRIEIKRLIAPRGVAPRAAREAAPRQIQHVARD